MNRWHFIFLTILIFGGGWLWVSRVPSAAQSFNSGPQPAIGYAAPDFTLSTLDGTPQPGDEHMLAILLDWASSDRQRRGILCETPAMLYDFPEI